MDKLSKITSELGERYKAWKKSEADKDESRKAFFQAVTEELEGTTPPTKTVVVEGSDPNEVELWAKGAYPAWNISAIRPLSDSSFEVMLEGSLDYEAYSYVNKETGMVFRRTVRAGSLSLDDERMKEIDPKLYEEVTQEIVTRELRPLEELSPDQKQRVESFLIEGKPRVVLEAPRKAKDEELDA